MNLEFVAALFALMPTLTLSDCPNHVDLGIGDRSIIADSQITASSSYEELYPWKGRLRKHAGNWAANDKGTDNWIQVDLLWHHIITGIKTQGSAITGYNEWVSRLAVQTGDTQGSLKYIRERDKKVMLFDANSNRNAIKVIQFPEPMTARILRIVTKQCHEWCSLRFEVTGCDLFNECVEDPDICGGGECEVLTVGYRCHCLDGFVGGWCQDVNECRLNNPCQNSARCSNIRGSYTCQCTQGWRGKNCNLDIDECEAEGLCQNGGSCTNAQGSYTCACTDGWRGNNCDIDIDECETTSPCQNGASCTNAPGSYTCACTDGWRGRNCNRDIDECSTIQPCQHNSSCTNIRGSYSCTCTEGWAGTNCDVDVDECVNGNPCQNGGSCNNTQGGYTCVCLDGWTGTTCEVDFDECASGPCRNGATCTDDVDGYNCTCSTEYTGVNCELEKLGEAEALSGTANTGAIAGGISSVVMVIFVVLVLVLLYRRRAQRIKPNNTKLEFVGPYDITISGADSQANVGSNHVYSNGAFQRDEESKILLRSNTKLDHEYVYADVRDDKEPNIDENMYTYAKTTGEPSGIMQRTVNSAGDNSIYACSDGDTELSVSQTDAAMSGWKNNSIYANTSDSDYDNLKSNRKSGWKENSIYANSNGNEYELD